MPTLAIDASNYTGELRPEVLEAWKAANVGLVIVQAVEPPAGYPVGVTRQQVQACVEAGMNVDAYVWLWFDLPMNNIYRKLALLEGLPIRQLWLDVEDDAAAHHSQSDVVERIQWALERLDAWPTTSGQRAGIYTARWYWDRCLPGVVAFSDRELWDADHDEIQDTEQSWQPYGGWSRRRIKQYRGTSTLSGQGGVDLNVLSVEEATEVTGDGEQVPSRADLLNAIGYLCSAAANQPSVRNQLATEVARPRVRKRPLRAILAELDRVGRQYLGGGE